MGLSIGGTPIQAPKDIPQGGSNAAENIIKTGVTLFLLFAIILSLFYLIQGGIQWMTSGGNKPQLEQARLRITYAVVGLIVSLGGFFIVTLVYRFFNISF